MKEIETYQDLLDALTAMSDEQLAQPIQAAKSPCTEEPVELQCGIAIGTVAEFEFAGARSVIDNKYHAEEVVLLIDGNPFAKDGAYAYELTDDGDVPLYRDGGPTKPEDQRASLVPKHEDFRMHVAPVCKRRMASMKQ